MSTIAEVRTAKLEVEADLLRLPGVTGIDIGTKIVDGRETGELAIIVYVERKGQFAAGQEIQPVLGGVKTDIIERRFFLARAKTAVANARSVLPNVDNGTYDPLIGGISIGPCRSYGTFIYSGTLGLVVNDALTDAPMLLSNFHVMAVDSAWSKSDSMSQPSLGDQGSCPTNNAGTLFKASLTDFVDAAIASPSRQANLDEIKEIGKVLGPGRAIEAMPVRKRGRTTGLTKGIIVSTDLSVNIDYEHGVGVRTLRSQIYITGGLGTHGDSGSVVVNDQNKVVGLYFAGDDQGNGVANPIYPVLETMGVSIGPSLKIAGTISTIFASQRRHSEVFFQRRDTFLQYFYVDNGQWLGDGDSFKIAGAIAGEIAAVFEPQRNHSAVFVKGEDGFLHYFYLGAGGWQHDNNSFKIAGAIAGGIAAVFEPQRHHSAVFVKGEDEFLHYFYLGAGGWQHDGSSFRNS